MTDKRAHIVELHSDEMSRIDKSTDSESRLVVTRVGGRGMRFTASGHGISFRGTKMFWN